MEKAGHEIIGAARKSSPNAYAEYLDIASKKSCEELLSKHPGLDAIVHCAAIAHTKPGILSQRQYCLINSEGTKNVIDAAVAYGVKRFVFISSISVYGEFDLPTPVLETCPTKPLGYYGISKKIAEDFCLERKNEIDLYIFRMTTMYGKDWLFNIRKKVVPPIIGKHFYLIMDAMSPRYSLCSDKNGAEAVLWAVENRIPSTIYNVADRYDYCLQDILIAVERIEGKRTHIYIPYIIPSAMLRLLAKIAPIARWRVNAYSRYWKFFRNNLYSTAKLRKTGFYAPPVLLNMAKK